MRSRKKRVFTFLMGSVLLLALLAATACATGQEAPPQTSTSVGQATASPPQLTSGGQGGAALYQVVTFTTSDGVVLSGRLFGSGDAGIILAHMYPADQTSWQSAAQTLAGEGYLVLTFDFRGYGESEGKKDIQYLDRDVLAAINALAQAGATRTVLMGASMGGTASLVAAEQVLSQQASGEQTGSPTPEICGVITLSAPVEFKGLSAAEAVPRLACALLFLAAEKDVGAESAKELARLAQGRSQLYIFPGSEHGTNLLQGPQAEQIWQIIGNFLDDHLPVR